MRKSIVSILLICIMFCACYAYAIDQSEVVTEFHTIPVDQSLETLNEMEGAYAFQNQLDHPDSKYYVINDYYNMESQGSLHILPHFETYQQTTEYSCGCASSLMALVHFGIHEYNEMDICQIAGTDTHRGSSVEGLVSFFDNAGLQTEFHADISKKFDSIGDCESFLIQKIDNGEPILVSWVDWQGHWAVIIGIDTVGTDSPYDDVLILADPYDVTDHYQDGYYVVPFGRFYDMWREGPCVDKKIVYEQPFIVVTDPEVLPR